MSSTLFRAATFGLALLGGAAALPFTASGASAACVVNVAGWDVLWMRSGPSTAYARIGSLPPYACGVSVTGPCAGNWCKVRWRGRRGWVSMRYISSAPRPGHCVTGVPRWDVLWVRSGPSVRYARIGSLPPAACGVRIRYCSRYRPNWCNIQWRGIRGWVNTRYLR
ncbi:MAG TPA: SH3 domain-containing protein [Thermopetrobacter sp.]|nr:SH3 domain-containing protein [Thermopetrobacter sp.]